MEHLVSIRCFNIVYTTISCELEFPSSKGDKKLFFVYLNSDNRISDCITKDKDRKRVWFREFATFLFRKFKRDVEYNMHKNLINTKLNWEDFLAIFKMILYLAIERHGLEKYRFKDFSETTYKMLYDRHDNKYTFNSYKDKHIIYPSENTNIIDPIFNLPHLVYATIDKLYPIQERLSKFFFYNPYDTTWLVSKGKDWTFLDDYDREEFLNKYVDDSFKKVWYIYKISNNGDCKKYIQYFKTEGDSYEYETVNFYNDNVDLYKIATYYEEEAIKIRNMLNSSEKDKKHQWRISADTLKAHEGNNDTCEENTKDNSSLKEPAPFTADDMFKNIGYRCEFIINKEFERLGHFEETDHYLYSFPNSPIKDKYIKIYTNGKFICNQVITPSEHAAIIKKLEEIKNDKN